LVSATIDTKELDADAKTTHQLNQVCAAMMAKVGGGGFRKALASNAAALTEPNTAKLLELFRGNGK
jgi:hypothetical protein